MTYLITFVTLLSRILQLVIFVRILLSWVPMAQSGKFAELVHQITDPIVDPIRRVVPTLGGLDFSSMIAFFIVQFAERILVALLSGLG